MTAPNASYSPPTLLIGLSTGASVLGITLITPALPFISDDFDVNANVAQFLFTGYLLMLALGAVRRMRTRIGLLAQPEPMRSIIDTTQ